MKHFELNISKSELLLEVWTMAVFKIALVRENFQISAEAFHAASDDLSTSEPEERKLIDSNHLQVS